MTVHRLLLEPGEQALVPRRRGVRRVGRVRREEHEQRLRLVVGVAHPIGKNTLFADNEQRQATNNGQRNEPAVHHGSQQNLEFPIEATVLLTSRGRCWR